MRSEHHRHWREALGIFGPALLLTLLGFILAYQFVDPAPPDHIRLATGQRSGAYYQFSDKYRAALAREHVGLEVLETAGSLDNIALLERRQADVAFVQGGVAGAEALSDLRSLGSLYFEPIWVFHRPDPQVLLLTDLAGRRIAVGAQGSGTRALALQLLQDNAIDDSNSSLLPLNGEQAAAALLRGDVDAAFFVASPQSPAVRQLLRSGQVQLLSFSRADAYTRLHRYLSRVVLPQGVIDLKRNLPEEDKVLLAASANLVIHRELHPALIDLLLQVAKEVHGSGGWFEQAGDFPSRTHLDFPLAKEARRFYDYGPPFLQRYLPFWAATLIDRLKVMLLPLVALMLPLFKLMPPLYRWRMRSRIYRWYRELLAIDRAIYQATGAEQRRALRAELEEIEQQATKIRVPLSFAEELYDLRLHLALVRERLDSVSGAPGGPGSPSRAG